MKLRLTFKLFILSLLLFTARAVKAQSASTQWAKDGYHFYELQNGRLIFVMLAKPPCWFPKLC